MLVSNASLRRKLLAPFLITAAALGAIALWGNDRLSQQRLEDKSLERAQLVANLLNYVAENASFRGELQRTVASIGAEPDILEIVVAGGAPPRIVASTKQVWIGRALADLPGEEFADDLNRAIAGGRAHSHFNEELHLVDYTAPLLLSLSDVAHDSLAKGAVMVHIDTDPVRATVQRSTYTYLGMFGTVLLALSGFGYLLIHRVVLRPLAAIGALVSKSDTKNDAAWRTIQTGDELGSLAKTLRDSMVRADSAIHSLAQQKDAARESEDRYRLIAAYSSDIISRFEADGTLRYVSPASSNVLGYEPGTMVGNSIFDWIHPDDLADARRAVETVLGSFQLETMTCRMRGVEGDFVWMETSLRELRDSTSKTRQVVAVSRNITERKAAEEEVRDHAEQMSAILDNMVDGIVTINEQGIIDSINPSVEQIFGYAREEILGKKVNMLMPNPHRENHDQYLSNYRQTGTARIIGIGREVEGQRKDGSVFPLDLAVSEITRQGSRMYIGILRDISERKRVERMKNEFVSAVSHEIRTPMNAVLGYVQLLEYDDNLTSKQKIQLSRIRDAGDHLINIINDVLDLSRIEAGKVTLSIEAVPVQEVLTECKSLSQPLADSRKIHLHVDTESGHGVQIRADRTRLRQVLLNLISNAIKYNRDGGGVWVQCDSNSSSGVRISVRDNGPGISPEKQSGLFQPFNRLGAERGHIEGTGIGLTITKNLVELMSGTIGVESDVGQGSTFWFELPLDHRESMISDTSKQQLATEGMDKRPGHHLVLYIEDNPVNFEFVQAICERFWPNMRLLGADTAEDGLRTAEQHRPDLILMDLNLPGIDGYEALSRLRKNTTLRNIPVVAVSANAMQENLDRARSSGFDAFIPKPIDVPEFLSMLDEQLPTNRRRAIGDRGQRVLVVDDSPVNLDIALALIENMGHPVDVVGDGAAAVQAVQRERYAAILMDCEMPTLDGYAATRTIRALGGDTNEIPIIALTAHAEDENRTKREAAGMDDFLAKPLRPEELATVLRRWIAVPTKSYPATIQPENTDVLDSHMTNQLAQMLGSRLGNIIDALIKDISNRLERLRAAIESRDTESIRREAHTMKGGSSNLGAKEFAATCRRVEEKAMSGKLEGMINEHSELAQQFHEKLVPALEKLKESAGKQSTKIAK